MEIPLPRDRLTLTGHAVAEHRAARHRQGDAGLSFRPVPA